MGGLRPGPPLNRTPASPSAIFAPMTEPLREYPVNRIPDALIIPESQKSGARMVDRVASILAVAEPLLGVDRRQGERGYIRIQPGGRLFITKDPADTLLFPKGHPRDGQERYHWIAGENQVELGFKKPETTDA